MRFATVLKYVGISTTAFIAVVIGGAYVFFSSLPDICGNEAIAEVPSPDGVKKAVVFVRDCGATTDFSTHVAVLNRGDSLASTDESIFAADTNHGVAAVGAGGGPEVMAIWNSVSELVVRVSKGARVHRAKSSVGAITIKHEVAKAKNGG